MATQKIPGRAIKLGTDTAGDVMYYDGAGWVRLAIGTIGQRLTMNEAGTFPQWGNEPLYQGRTYGYDAGGRTTSTVKSDVIQKYSFSTDGNATDVSNLTVAKDQVVASASATHGYYGGGAVFDDHPPTGTVIERQQFATSNNAVDVGDLFEAAGTASPSNSNTHGYLAGGTNSTVGDSGINTIQKFAFASTSNATNVADSVIVSFQAAGHSDWTGSYAYKSGGYSNVDTGRSSNGRNNLIERYPFSSDSDATDIGDLFTFTTDTTGTSSLTHGYAQGGNDGASPTVLVDHIQKFAFASTSNATDIGNLTVPRYHVSESSSITHGYAAGGNDGFFTSYNVTVDKYTFASDANATDVGDVIAVHTSAAGTQV